MCNAKRHVLPPLQQLLGAFLLAGGCLALCAGCKNSTTSAATPERAIPAPPVITAYSTPADLRNDNVLISPTWRNAKWYAFTSPSNTSTTTAPTRAALLFDADMLYVAFISQRQPAISNAPASGDTLTRDAISLYLDTENADKNMVQIAVDSGGKASATWFRSSSPALPLADGTPDFAHPISSDPDIRIPGLITNVSEQLDGDTPVWTALLAVPLRTLPLPLRTVASAGAHWKFNLTRTIITTNAGRRIEDLQSNLSPFHIGAQAVSPYRLAKLVLSDGSIAQASAGK